MEFLIDLWLPILLNGVVLFVLSFVAWVILPHHFNDFSMLPEESDFMDAVERMNIPVGNYMFPYAKSKVEQGSPEYQEKYKVGPRGTLQVFSMPNMGVNMAKTVVFFLVTSAVIGYITYFACPPIAEGQFMKVFRIAGTIGILVHASSGILNGIWFQRKMLTNFVDGVVYGLILGLIFAFLWPVTS